MPVPNCDTGFQPSRIPGNIGTLKSKVMVWDHDPFWARPTQIYSFPFSQATGEQMRDPAPNIQFEVGGAFLRPTFRHHDMFVCTLNKDKNSGGFSTLDGERSFVGETTVNPEVDFVGSVESGVGLIAAPRMPGGEIYDCDGGAGGDQTSDSVCAVTLPDGEVVNAADETTGKSIFSHQVWRHEGSLFRDNPLIHPSEYQKPLSELQQARNSGSGSDVTIDELQSAAKWDYIEVADNGKLSIWPMMITKQSPNLKNTVHWTLEKWTPVWQGQDFYITVRLGDKKTDDAVDPLDGSTVESLADAYFPHLWYNIERNGTDVIPGITNQAFHIDAQRDDNRVVSEAARTAAKKAARKNYDWRYQTYILIEIGAFDSVHNYFIELVKGRNPRFLHLGEEWDNPHRLEEGVDADSSADDAGFTYMKKCREISVYPHVKCDQLFRQKDFRVNVRNHLGRMVVTFEGYEGQPWVISRQDNDPRKTDFSKIIIPMVVPSALMRLHGGNISCAINYSPTEYRPIATIPFVNRQVDTGPDTPARAKNKDVYMTFSHMGNSLQYTNEGVRRKFFDDDRFVYDKVGYDCDAFTVYEKNKNTTVPIEIYKEYDKQYRIYGKGWYNETPRTSKGDWEVQRDPVTLLPLQPVEINGMDPNQGSGTHGVPSHLKIVNARNPSAEFPLSLTDGIDGHYEWKEYVAKWDVGIEFKAGSVKLSNPSGDRGLPITGNVKSKVFVNYVTPIATSWRLIVLGGGKPFEGAVIPFDISALVSKITDSWSSEDFFSLSHEMQMECYIPIESTSDTTSRNIEDQELINLFALGRKLLPLHDKAFYITISYWWDTGIGHRWVESNELNREGGNPNLNDVLIQMTGIAYGAQLTRSNNRLFMSFNIKDYMSVLENQFIFNSPFFDGVQDVQAVYELAKLAGFADESVRALGVDRKPLGYLRKVMDDGDRVGERLFTYNGEKSRSERYDLKGTYSSLAEPAMKFQNGETYESAVKRIAQLGGKVVYFDRWGVLRMETPSALIAAHSSANEDLEFTPVFDFVTTPIVRQTNVPNSGTQNSDFEFDPEVHAAHLVYNSITYQRSVEECANQIVILSASNSIKKADGSVLGGFIIEGYTFFDQMWKPESEGFIGYRKPLYQSEGAFGDVESVRNAISMYAKKKFPPVIMTFETYGVPGLKALDIITLDGNLAYITEISHELDPATNRWWMNITAEWLKPFKGELGFLETFEPDTGDVGGGDEG